MHNLNFMYGTICFLYLFPLSVIFKLRLKYKYFKNKLYWHQNHNTYQIRYYERAFHSCVTKRIVCIECAECMYSEKFCKMHRENSCQGIIFSEVTELRNHPS